MSVDDPGVTEGGGGHVAVASGTDGSAPPPSRPWTPRALTEVRSRRGRRFVALVVAVVVGVALAWVHWVGLFVAGVLVGLASRTLPCALVTGLGLGVIVLVVHVLASPQMDPGEFLALTPAAYVTVGAGLGGPVWGSLVRGVV